MITTDAYTDNYRERRQYPQIIAILGCTAARQRRTTTWEEIVRTTERVEADLSGLHA